MGINELLLNIGGFVIGLFIGIMMFTIILVALFFQIPFIKKLQKSKIISEVRWSAQITRLLLAVATLSGMMLIPSLGLRFGVTIALFNTIILLTKKNQRNNIYSDIIKDSVVKNERFKIKDSYNWSSFASSVMIIEKMVEHIQQLKKNIATIDQQFSQDDSSRYDFVAMIQIGTINKIIEVNETLRDYMLISPATDWGEIGDREKIYIDELLDKMESDNNSLNQLLSELYNE